MGQGIARRQAISVVYSANRRHAVDNIYTSLDAFDRCLLVVGRVTDVSTAGDYFPPVRQNSPPGYYYSGNPFPAKPDQIYRPHSVFYQGRLIQRARRIEGPQASGGPKQPMR